VREIREIIIHCSATHPGRDIGAADIRGWHLSRGWKDIGYHYVIRRDGVIEKGRDIEQVGAHVEGHNQHSIGICMVGGVNRSNQPDANFTWRQWTTLHELVSVLKENHPEANVTGHRAYTSTKACPSFDAVAWWNQA